MICGPVVSTLSECFLCDYRLSTQIYYSKFYIFTKFTGEFNIRKMLRNTELGDTAVTNNLKLLVVYKRLCLAHAN